MDRPRLSLARRFLIWYMKAPPFNPYVAINAAADFRVDVPFTAVDSPAGENV